MSKKKRTFLCRIKRRKFGELLLSQGSITPEQLEEALELQQRDGGLLGEIMVLKGFISKNEIVRSLSMQYGLPVLRLRNYHVDKDLVARFKPELLYVNLVLPLSKIGDLLLVTAADLPDDSTIAALEEEGPFEVVFYVSSTTDISEALAKYVPVSEDLADEFVSRRRHKGVLPAERVEEEPEEQPVFGELDNSWESIFDQAEQNVKQGGV